MSRPSFESFLQCRGRDKRLARLTHDVQMPAATGIEIGAADNPVTLPNTFDVEYVDYRVDVPGVDIDHIWAGNGSFAAICGRKDFYDFAIASRVAEHVPNLLGWFNGLYAVLRPGGVLNLALPDRRFMFNILRNPSTIGEAVEAYYLQLARPSIRQLFDHTVGAARVEPDEIWSGATMSSIVGRLSAADALDFAHEQYRQVLETQHYVTCHCWVFTPLSFLELMETASRLRLFPFVISQFSTTEPGGSEFFVCFRRDIEAQPDRLLHKQLGALAYIRQILERHNREARLRGGS